MRGHGRLRVEVERMRIPGRLEVPGGAERLRLRGPARERARCGVDDLEAGLDPLDVDQRREPDRAVAVQLDRPLAGGGDEVRRQLADRVGGQQPARVLEVEAVHLGAVGQRGSALRRSRRGCAQG